MRRGTGCILFLRMPAYACPPWAHPNGTVFDPPSVIPSLRLVVGNQRAVLEGLIRECDRDFQVTANCPSTETQHWRYAL